MEQITGRLTANAEIKRTNSGKELVAFTVAVNRRYKPKNGAEVNETRFFNCAYWQSTKVQAILKKGCIVSVMGTINVNAYKKADGEYHANLVCHASHIEIFGVPMKNTNANPQPLVSTTPTGTPETKNDLPF